MNLKIDIEAYTGPFDVLLRLIEKQKLDIYDIKIEDITAPYLEEIKKIDIPLDELSEFIYISSILLAIKSNKLLPKEEDNDLEEDLIKYLIEYKKIKSVQDEFKYLEEEGLKYFSKYQEDLSKYSGKDELIIHDVGLLSKEFQKLMLKIGDKPYTNQVINQIKELDVNDYVEKIRKTLNFSRSIKLIDITKEIKDKKACIATFLALLELVRTKEIFLNEIKDNSFAIVKR
ncbi:MAG: segregation/condensation protein A [Peptoniphilaceae bacterium]|nr:segregation/condensation protein A [Peptoniphilaceae bacterium]MDY6019387.1 segregation/condensation protein A [Anaerococcus sp.]